MKNGANVGDLNHSKIFANEFRKNCAEVLHSQLRQKLDTPLPSTNQRPPVAISVDKMTQKKRLGQITAIGTLVPEAPPDEMVQTYFVGNPVVRNHTGVGLAESAIKELKKVMNKEHFSDQIIGGGTDGQYFILYFEDHENDPRHLFASLLHRSEKVNNIQRCF